MGIQYNRENIPRDWEGVRAGFEVRGEWQGDVKCSWLLSTHLETFQHCSQGADP